MSPYSSHNKQVAPIQKPKTEKESKYFPYKNIDTGGTIALHYGFAPTETPEIKRVDLDHSRALLEGDFIEDEGENGAVFPLHVEEKVAVLRTYIERNMYSMPQPVMMYFKGAFKGSLSKKNHPCPRYADLEIIGNPKSIAEATLIKTALTILEEYGYKDLCVEINSIGDRESITKFTRELTSYYRKNIEGLSSHGRQLLKKDVFELLTYSDKKNDVLKEDAPKSITFLSEPSRIHFKEVLEFLEKLDIPYKINHHLIGNRKYCSETIFEIVTHSDSKKSAECQTLAIGVRYDGLAKKIALKKDVSGVGISLLFKRPSKEKTIAKIKRPILYFVQLGFEAKLYSLQVIEILRNAGVMVHQALSKDKLAGQLSVAERIETPYMILIGKKEAMEKSAIVRDVVTRSQETVPLSQLAQYVKKLGA